MRSVLTRVLVAMLAATVAGQGLELPTTASRTSANCRAQRGRSPQNVRPRAGSVLKALQVERDQAPPGADAGNSQAGPPGPPLFRVVLAFAGRVLPPGVQPASDPLPASTSARGPPFFLV